MTVVLWRMTHWTLAGVQLRVGQAANVVQAYTIASPPVSASFSRLYILCMQVVALFQSYSGPAGGKDLVPVFGDFSARFAQNARFIAVDISRIQVRRRGSRLRAVPPVPLL